MKIKRNNKQGISLIVLVISVIVMIILAGAIIISINNTGVLSSADKAKLDTEIANEKEILNFCVVNAKVKDENRELKLDKLNEELTQYSAQAYMEVDTIIVQFNKSGRYYEIDANGKSEHVQASGLKTLTLEYKTSGGTILGTKEYTIIKDKYSIELPVIEGYEPLDMVATGTITESTTVEIPYYVIFDDDTELVFTGLDSSGKVTTVESDIVTYMVGDGTTTNGNGLKDKISQGILKIPEAYKGKPVDQIGGWAFEGVGTIIKAIVGNEVKTIGREAFTSCKNMKEIVLGNNVTVINAWAFGSCSKLKTLIVNIEKTGLSMGAAFTGCTNFNNIEVSENNPEYKAVDNILYSKDGKILYLVPTGREGELTLPEGVETIVSNACLEGKIEKLVLPNSVKTIGREAFGTCTNLEEITLGKNITSLNGYVFDSCKNLKVVNINTETSNINFNVFGRCSMFTEIKVEENNPTYKVVDNILYSKDGTVLYLVPTGRNGELTIPEGVETLFAGSIAGCTNITKIIMPDSLKVIGGSAMDGCTGLLQVVMGKNITTISNWAFDSSSKITEITIGEYVNQCGGLAFHGCTSLNTVNIESKAIAKILNEQIAAGYLVNYATTIYIKEGITEIGSYVVDNFDVADTDKEGYVKYVRKTT